MIPEFLIHKDVKKVYLKQSWSPYRLRAAPESRMLMGFLKWKRRFSLPTYHGHDWHLLFLLSGGFVDLLSQALVEIQPLGYPT